MSEINTTPAALSTAPSHFELLPLEAMQPSSTQVQLERRERFDAKALKELTATVKEVGVLEPIVVRPIAADPAKPYEIVAGERRWRAAQAAGLPSIPAVIRELTDGQVLRLQLIENIQREELHGLAEVEAFATLMKDHDYTVDRLATEVGKQRAYVAQRLKLLALCPAARQAFDKGKLSLSTALLLARVPVEDLQRRALKDITEGRNAGDPMTAREASRHLYANYMLRLESASFPTQDAELVAAAGPCGSCPKRTGNQPELFKDVQGADVCTDPGCFAAKRAAWTTRQLEEAKRAGRTVIDGAAAKRIMPYGPHSLQGHVRPSDRCYEDKKNRTYRELLGDALEPAVLLSPETGDLVEVVDRKSIEPLLKARGVSPSKPKSSSTEREQRARLKRESAFRWQLLEAVRQKSPATLSREALEDIALTTFTHHGYESRKRLLKLWQWKQKKGKEFDSVHHEGAARTSIPKLSDAELTRFLLDCVLVSELHVSAWIKNDKPERLLAAAKKLRLDVEAIRKDSAGTPDLKKNMLDPAKAGTRRSSRKVIRKCARNVTSKAA